MVTANDREKMWRRARQRFWGCALLCGLVLMATIVGATPADLVPIALGAIQRDAGPGYGVRGEHARNDQQAWHIHFAAQSVKVRAATGEPWTFALSLQRFGSADALRAVPAASREIAGNRVLYRRSGLDEWYLNGPMGLEQGFTVHRPFGDTLVLELSASWPVAVDGTGVRFTQGHQSLHLGALYAFDATGRACPAHLRVAGAGMQIEVDARGAVYPLTIDPVLTGRKTLVASDADPFNWFGRSIALASDGNTALIGAPANLAAYVFVRRNGTWVEEQKIRRPSGLTCTGNFTASMFGQSVALSADAKTALIGASGRINVGIDIIPIWVHSSCLEALVYVKSGDRWLLDKRLRGRDVSPNNLFGSAVALSATGTTALIGAEFADFVACPRDAPDYCGAVYIFERNTTGWRQRAMFRGASPAAHRLGIDVALSANGAWALAGTTSNAVRTFTRTPLGWRRHNTIRVADSRTGDGFGFALALSATGQRALIGAPYVECPRGNNCGLAYTFVRQGDVWVEEARLAPADLNSHFSFAEAVALSLDGLRALIGSSGADCPNGNCGAAYVFDRVAGNWVEKGRVTSPTAGLGGSELGGAFGESVATSGNGRTVLVGAHLEACTAGKDCGAAYVYSRPD